MSDNKKPTIQERVKNMPAWLQTWYAIAVEIIEVGLATHCTDVDPNQRKSVAEALAFPLATREYKQRQINRRVYADAMETIMSASDVFELNVGHAPQMRLRVHPADGNGVVNIALEPADGDSHL